MRVHSCCCCLLIHYPEKTGRTLLEEVLLLLLETQRPIYDYGVQLLEKSLGQLALLNVVALDKVFELIDAVVIHELRLVLRVRIQHLLKDPDQHFEFLVRELLSLFMTLHESLVLHQLLNLLLLAKVIVTAALVSRSTWVERLRGVAHLGNITSTTML